MAEVEELCERLAIVDRGRILAIGTSAELKRRVQRESIFRLELDRLDGGPGAIASMPGVLSAVSASDDEAEGDRERQHVAVNLVLADDTALGPVVTALGQRGSHIVALAKSEPTLEDVFVELVGRGFEAESDDGEHAAADGSDARSGDRGPVRGEERQAEDAPLDATGLPER